MGVAEEILVLIKYSPKREDIIGCITEQMEFESEPEEKANDITKKKKKNHKFLDKSIYFCLAFESYCFHGHA